MNYEYSVGLLAHPPARPLSQLRERSLGSARSHYNSGVRNDLTMMNFNQPSDLSHIKINDLLSHRRNDYNNDLISQTEMKNIE
jgi:hypothetical protein